MGNLLEKYRLKDKEMAKGQQETAGDPDTGDPDAAPEPPMEKNPKGNL